MTAYGPMLTPRRDLRERSDDGGGVNSGDAIGGLIEQQRGGFCECQLWAGDGGGRSCRGV